MEEDTSTGGSTDREHLRGTAMKREHRDLNSSFTGPRSSRRKIPVESLVRYLQRTPHRIAILYVEKLAGCLHWIDAGFLPPGGLIAHPAHQSMMDLTERDREFIAYLAPKSAGLDQNFFSAETKTLR
jgi:hypothetical protein